MKYYYVEIASGDAQDNYLMKIKASSAKIAREKITGCGWSVSQVFTAKQANKSHWRGYLRGSIVFGG